MSGEGCSKFGLEKVLRFWLEVDVLDVWLVVLELWLLECWEVV